MNKKLFALAATLALSGLAFFFQTPGQALATQSSTCVQVPAEAIVMPRSPQKLPPIIVQQESAADLEPAAPQIIIIRRTPVRSLLDWLGDSLLHSRQGGRQHRGHHR
jgi:hypothetical protein